jgi:hypothetical protein
MLLARTMRSIATRFTVIILDRVGVNLNSKRDAWENMPPQGFGDVQTWRFVQQI